MQATSNSLAQAQAKTYWLEALSSLGVTDRGGPIWNGTGLVAERLGRFVDTAGAQTLHLDGARSMWNGIQRTAERGVLMATLNGRPTHLFKPSFLALEHFPDCPQDSYMVLGLEDLEPNTKVARGALREELASFRGGVAANGVELGSLDAAGAVSRCLHGHILIACAGSTWSTLETPEVATVIDYVRRRMARQQVRVAA